MRPRPPELAWTVEEHATAAVYHDGREQIMRSAGRPAVADAHRNAAVLHRLAVQHGPETKLAPDGPPDDEIGDPRIDDRIRSRPPEDVSAGAMARRASNMAAQVEVDPHMERVFERMAKLPNPSGTAGA